MKSHSPLIAGEVGPCRSADRFRILVIPSGVEGISTLEKGFLDLAWAKMVRDVSVRAGLAYSLDMTKGECSRC